jgi:PAS domain S-box-containing protein
MGSAKTYQELLAENESLRNQLEEATDTIHAIRTGQVDALVVNGQYGHQLYTLKTADQTYRVFIEKMNEGAVTLNRDGIILYCNTRFSKIVKLPLSGVIGLHFQSFIAPEYLDTYNELFRNGWHEDSKAEVYIRCEANANAFLLSATALELDGGVSLSVILTDLSFHKNIENLLRLNNQKLADTVSELETSNNDLLQFASVASHDLQEPLRKIMIFSTLLREKYTDHLSDDAVKFLEKIISSSHRMKTLILDILDYSRLSTNEDHFAPTDLNDVIDEVLEDYELVISEKNAVITVGRLQQVDVNRGQLRQVFQNLISNSLKFTRSDVQPRIEIQASVVAPNTFAEPDAGTLVITFVDNGIGFNERYVEKIFSLFQRLNTKDKYEGSGIGLAITKKIIEKHNGKIEASSTEGQGAKFTISLPIRQPVVTNLSPQES